MSNGDPVLEKVCDAKMIAIEKDIDENKTDLTRSMNQVRDHFKLIHSKIDNRTGWIIAFLLLVLATLGADMFVKMGERETLEKLLSQGARITLNDKGGKP